MKRICIVAGARPNFVKISPLIHAIQKSRGAIYQLVYTGKKDDPTLEASLFEDLQIPFPDVFLGVDSQSLNEITALVMGSFDRYLIEHATDVVIVVDDLASTMAAAITAKKRGIKLAHLVAGTRSFDINMPKEVNRLVIDALSDYLFTAGVKSNSVATREQQSESSQTFMVGNILVDTLRNNLSRFRKPDIPLVEEDYLVLTINRHALLEDEENLKRMLNIIMEVAGETPVIAPLRSNVYDVVSRLLGRQHNPIHFCTSMSYLEFGWLTAHAKGIITDSGNVAEEATFNGIPCITLNSYTEHQETVTVGSNVLVGGDANKLLVALTDMMKGEWKKCALPERWDGRTADRILQILIHSSELS
ncbi:MAG: UDP-N-acetyl glucosamine 2-epimerase [Prevotella sp.]|jgi:UDP-N-acetylglucosamine 2-epimerase (non-hydrolysing)|nr:UDP-N-acetyl glucosamine 2-epimerase [Prevotella sp.]